MIKVKDAIESGDFLSLSFVDEGVGTFAFQIKCIDFYQVDMSLVDINEYVKEVESDSNLWIIDLDVINLNKKVYDAGELRSIIKLVDDEGYEYSALRDDGFLDFTEFGKSSKLNKFVHDIFLKPKIIKNGAIAFELPDYFDELFLHVEEGNIETL